MTPKARDQVLSVAYTCSKIDALKIGCELWLGSGKDMSREHLEHHLRLVMNQDRLLEATETGITVEGCEPFVIGRQGSAMECRVMAGRAVLGLTPKPPFKPKKGVKKNLHELWLEYCSAVVRDADQAFRRVPK